MQENVNMDGEYISTARADGLSHKMAWLLRHQTHRFWSCDTKGRVRYGEFATMVQKGERRPPSHADIMYTITTNRKKRFQLWYAPGDSMARPTAISAIQGHSGDRVILAMLGERVDERNRGNLYIHGTYHRHIASILRYGLVPGGVGQTVRASRPVHLSRKLMSDQTRISGMRDKFEVIVYLNADTVAHAIKRGVLQFYHTDPDTTCCDQTIGPQYIERIVYAHYNLTMYSVRFKAIKNESCRGCGKRWPPGVQYCLDRACWYALNEKGLQDEVSRFRRGIYEERQAYFKRKYGFAEPVPGAKNLAIKSSKRKFGRSDCNARIKACKRAGPYQGHAHRFDTDSEYRQQCLINGVPRTLIVPIYDATGKPTGRDEVLEREYVDAFPEY